MYVFDEMKEVVNGVIGAPHYHGFRKQFDVFRIKVERGVRLTVQGSFDPQIREEIPMIADKDMGISMTRRIREALRNELGNHVVPPAMKGLDPVIITEDPRIHWMASFPLGEAFSRMKIGQEGIIIVERTTLHRVKFTSPKTTYVAPWQGDLRSQRDHLPIAGKSFRF